MSEKLGPLMEEPEMTEEQETTEAVEQKTTAEVQRRGFVERFSELARKCIRPTRFKTTVMSALLFLTGMAWLKRDRIVQSGFELIQHPKIVQYLDRSWAEELRFAERPSEKEVQVKPETGGEPLVVGDLKIGDANITLIEGNPTNLITRGELSGGEGRTVLDIADLEKDKLEGISSTENILCDKKPKIETQNPYLDNLVKVELRYLKSPQNPSRFREFVRQKIGEYSHQLPRESLNKDAFKQGNIGLNFLPLMESRLTDYC